MALLSTTVTLTLGADGSCDACVVCYSRGETLVLCEGQYQGRPCPASVHLPCVGLAAVPRRAFLCPVCVNEDAQDEQPAHNIWHVVHQLREVQRVGQRSAVFTILENGSLLTEVRSSVRTRASQGQRLPDEEDNVQEVEPVYLSYSLDEMGSSDACLLCGHEGELLLCVVARVCVCVIVRWCLRLMFVHSPQLRQPWLRRCLPCPVLRAHPRIHSRRTLALSLVPAPSPRRTGRRRRTGR